MKERQLRIGQSIKRELGVFFFKGMLHAPELADLSFTLSEVSLSKDLGWADVYITIWCPEKQFAKEEKEQIIARLNKEAWAVRRYIAKTLNMKKTPQIRFWYDPTFDTADKINALLDVN